MSTPDDPFKPPVSQVGASQKTGRFKKFALAVLASTLGTGLVLVVVMALAMLPDVFGPHNSSAYAPQYVKHPPGLRVVQHALVPGTDVFTVQGIVQNESTTEWESVFLEMAVKVAGKKVNKCTGNIGARMAAGSRRAFQIECEQTTGTDVPENTRYEVSITSARKATDDP